MRRIIILLFLVFAIQNSFAQLKSMQFEQIDSLQIKEKRNVIVFIHTEWCKYCKVMLAKTFKNENVINLLNNHFYFVDFNAETQRTITFNNSNFAFKPNGNNAGTHELAIELGTVDKQINYPVLCVLNVKNEIIFQYSGFLNAKDLVAVLEKI